MSQLYLPWTLGDRRNNHFQARNQFASSLELHKQPLYEYQEAIQRQRSPSLPPINNVEIIQPLNKEEIKGAKAFNRNIPSAKRFSFYDEDGEGDTSGYGSETLNHMNIRSHRGSNEKGQHPVMAWQQDNRNYTPAAGKSPPPADGNWSARSPRSATGDEGRLRWGDRGVATGRLWEPTAPNARLPQMQNQKKGTPSWVERGLNMIENTAEVLVIDQRSSTNSGADCDRLSNDSDETRTFLRGQNVPLEPEIKAQRENKRIKALELQSALASQLEDRERRRQNEKERKLREERLEELRIQKQREEDRLKVEEERRKHEEKLLQEQRKLEALKQALENAEKQARQDKEKRYNYHKPNIDVNVCNDIKLNVQENEIHEPLQQFKETNNTVSSSRNYDAQSYKSHKNECNSQHTSEFNSPRSIGHKNLNLFIHSVPPVALTDSPYSIVPITINGEVATSPPNSIQFAVLVPQNINNNLYNLSLNSLNDLSESLDAAKILTPSKYRIGKTKNVSTQTDPNLCQSLFDKTIENDLERNIDKNYANIDENAPQDTTKKDRRFRSEERYKKDLENRPKWGVNRPAAQYKKQSEKDPFYSQKRKIRQKHRPQIQYLSQSSDDSRSPSPPTRSDKTTENYSKQRNSLSQSYWRNKRSSQDLRRNTSVPEAITAVVSEQKAKDQITIDESLENKVSPKMSPMKRITLSQKFINDKYGNRKLWIDEVNETNLKTNLLDNENRKKIIDQLNSARKDFLEKNEDQEDVIKTKY